MESNNELQREIKRLTNELSWANKMIFSQRLSLGTKVPFTVSYMRDLEKQLNFEQISYSRMIELLNEKAAHFYAAPNETTKREPRLMIVSGHRSAHKTQQTIKEIKYWDMVYKGNPDFKGFVWDFDRFPKFNYTSMELPPSIWDNMKCIIRFHSKPKENKIHPNMRSQEEIIAKKIEVEQSLNKLLDITPAKRTRSNEIQIEFHKNNLAFIEWALKLKSVAGFTDFAGKAFRSIDGDLICPSDVYYFVSKSTGVVFNTQANMNLAGMAETPHKTGPYKSGKKAEEAAAEIRKSLKPVFLDYTSRPCYIGETVWGVNVKADPKFVLLPYKIDAVNKVPPSRTYFKDKKTALGFLDRHLPRFSAAQVEEMAGRMLDPAKVSVLLSNLRQKPNQ